MQRFLLLLLIGCAPLSPRPDAERQRLETALVGKKVYAQCALYRGWFWDDPNRDLVTPHPVDHRTWLLDRKGNNVPTKARMRRVQPASIWFIDRISDPVGFERLARPLLSPRHLTWIHLHSGSTKAVVPVPEFLDKTEAILEWFGRQFTDKAPLTLELASPSIRTAIRQGRTVAGMNEEELRAALCGPDQVWRDRTVDPPVEKWIYLNQNGDHLVSVLLGGRSTGKTLRITDAEYQALPRSGNEQEPPSPAP